MTSELATDLDMTDASFVRDEYKGKSIAISKCVADEDGRRG